MKLSKKQQEIADILKRIETCLPENPYPEQFFPMTTEDYVKAIPDNKLRTAVSGCIARWQFDVAKRMILKAIKDELED